MTLLTRYCSAYRHLYHYSQNKWPLEQVHVWRKEPWKIKSVFLLISIWCILFFIAVLLYIVFCVCDFVTSWYIAISGCYVCMFKVHSQKQRTKDVPFIIEIPETASLYWMVVMGTPYVTHGGIMYDFVAALQSFALIRIKIFVSRNSYLSLMLMSGTYISYVTTLHSVVCGERSCVHLIRK